MIRRIRQKRHERRWRGRGDLLSLGQEFCLTPMEPCRYHRGETPAEFADRVDFLASVLWTRLTLWLREQERAEHG